jgi:hypothetical protein
MRTRAEGLCSAAEWTAKGWSQRDHAQHDQNPSLSAIWQSQIKLFAQRMRDEMFRRAQRRWGTGGDRAAPRQCLANPAPAVNRNPISGHIDQSAYAE